MSDIYSGPGEMFSVMEQLNTPLTKVELPMTFGTSPLLNLLERFATNPNFDKDTFNAVLKAHMRLVDGQKQSLYIRAMNAALAEIQQVKASGRNPVFNSDYPLLRDLDDACREYYTKHGLICTFGSMLVKSYDPPEPVQRENEQRIVLRISHTDTAWFEEIKLDVPKEPPHTGRGPATTPIQNVGKNITYARRYLLQMAFNLVPYNNRDDVDGEHQRAAGAPTNKLNARDWLRNYEIACKAAVTVSDMIDLQDQDDVKRAIAYYATHPGAQADEFNRITNEMSVRLTEPEKTDAEDH